MPSAAATRMTSSTVSNIARWKRSAASRPCAAAYCSRPPVISLVSQPPLRPGGAEAGEPLLEHDDPQVGARLLQVVGGPQPGVARADDRHVGVQVAGQLGAGFGAPICCHQCETWPLIMSGFLHRDAGRSASSQDRINPRDPASRAAQELSPGTQSRTQSRKMSGNSALSGVPGTAAYLAKSVTPSASSTSSTTSVCPGEFACGLGQHQVGGVGGDVGRASRTPSPVAAEQVLHGRGGDGGPRPERVRRDAVSATRPATRA